AVTSLRGRQTPILAEGQLSLVVFANPACTACGPTMQAVKRLRAVERNVRFLVAMDGEPEQGLIYAESYGLPEVVRSDSVKSLDGSARPFVIALSDDGVVLARGVPNTLEQLEALLASARHYNSIGSSAAISSEEGASSSRDELELVDLRYGAKGLETEQ